MQSAIVVLQLTSRLQCKDQEEQSLSRGLAVSVRHRFGEEHTHLQINEAPARVVRP